VDRVHEQDLPVIYYEELVDPKVARSLSETTGKPLLLLHSCHNVSREELGTVGFLELMEQNVVNLEKGLR
jgi:zinc transport system substrate-binding protein